MSYKKLSKHIIEMGLAAEADHDEVCPAGVGASALSVVLRLNWRAEEWLVFLLFVVIQFAGTNWKETHLFF